MLTDWIVAAAASLAFPVQSTSIPGVAQRTGATTYYIEILPLPWRELGGKRPVLALIARHRRHRHRGGERIDGGRPHDRERLRHARPHRSLIASTRRFYAMAEKIAMGDGRYDTETACRGRSRACARQRSCSTWTRQRADAGAMINAVMLGAIAASGACRSRSRRSRPRSAPTARRSRPTCGAFAPGSPPPASARRRAAAATAKIARRARPSASPTRGAGGRIAGAADIVVEGRAPPRRLSGHRLCAALSRPPARIARRRRARRRDGRLLARDRAPSRGAHVLRGRDPGRAGEDRARALRRGSPPRWAPSPASRSRSSNSSSPASRSCARSCRRASRPPILAFAERRGWLDRFIGAWRSNHLGHRLSALLVLAKLKRFRRAQPIAIARSRPRSRPGSR